MTKKTSPPPACKITNKKEKRTKQVLLHFSPSEMALVNEAYLAYAKLYSPDVNRSQFVRELILQAIKTNQGL